MKSYKSRKVIKIKGSASAEVDDFVAVEKRLKIFVNGRNIINLFCTPLMVRELVAGIVHNEGLIEGEWCADRMSIEYGEEIVVDIPASGSVIKGEPTVTSGCAGGISLMKARPGSAVSDNISFSAESVKRLFSEFQKRSEAYRLTGGIHSAAIADGKKIIAFAEDIGRHNAVDKVVGYFLLEGLPFKAKIMMASGRLSSDIVYKCSRCEVPVVVSRTSPTSLAVEIAEKAGITLVGFMRGDRMNVYTEKQRIKL